MPAQSKTARARRSLGRVMASHRWKHPAASVAFVDRLEALSLGEALHAVDVNSVIPGEAGAIAADAPVIPRP
jgi:hypothetical protein